jgi:hypothetical protein
MKPHRKAAAVRKELQALGIAFLCVLCGFAVKKSEI